MSDFDDCPHFPALLEWFAARAHERMVFEDGDQDGAWALYYYVLVYAKALGDL